MQGHPSPRRYISERGKIEPRRKLGTCAQHQRSLTVAIKRARHVASAVHHRNPVIDRIREPTITACRG